MYQLDTWEALLLAQPLAPPCDIHLQPTGKESWTKKKTHGELS